MSVNSKMTAIADAIRAKTGKTAPLSLDQMATEIEGISGGTELFAVIAAYYPTGSTITCTNGSTELTPVGTDGQCLFAVPFAGSWTVTATDGKNTKSQSVKITTEGEIMGVTLSYTYYVFKTGFGVADEWYAYDGGSAAAFADVDSTRIRLGSTSATGSSEASVSSVATYETSGYTTIHFDIDCGGISGGNVVVGIASSDTGGVFVASKTLAATGRQEVTVDISNCNGKYHVKAYQTAWPATQEIYNIWFS